MDENLKLLDIFSKDEEVFEIFEKDIDLLDKGIAFTKNKLRLVLHPNQITNSVLYPFREILLGIEPDCNGTNFMFEGGEYLILDEDELDEALNKYCQEVCLPDVLNEIPEHLQYYFDEEKYFDDLKVNDGVGLIATFDGEWDESYGELGVYYYIVRI